jgi:tetratricopeptide (TPR) repeat protein
MRAFVFTDKALQRHAGQFVWLSIDTEKSGNAATLAKYPVSVWPSFYVVDPQTETIALRWVGGATVPQLQKILDDGSHAIAGPKGGLDQILARADRLYGQGKNAEAAREYSEVLKRAPAAWPQRRRVLESLLFAFQGSHQSGLCAVTAKDAFASVAKTSSAANVAGSGLDCALSIPATDPSRKALVDALAADARLVLSRPRPDIAADDVSSLYQTLGEEREQAGDKEGRRKVQSDWASFLEAQAAAAKTPDARAVFDSHRLAAYLALEEPQRALVMLEASERDLPEDYNPPARLAVAYRELKRYDEALAASDRALAKAYGPRKIGILQTRADIYAKKGDSAAARRTLQEAIAAAESLPAPQRPEAAIASLKKKLEAMP